jgi:hypothetical protein
MKIKPRTKKIVVLSVMVVLLVATGVLNYVLNDKLTDVDDNPVDNNVTQTFFESSRDYRDGVRESELLYYDAIINSENSSESAKLAAEAKKMSILAMMDQEMEIETMIEALGYDDSYVLFSDTGVNVVVASAELTKEQANAIKQIVVDKTDYKATQIKINPYS